MLCTPWLAAKEIVVSSNTQPLDKYFQYPFSSWPNHYKMLSFYAHNSIVKIK
ncbi:hypothetical protein [Piscirickettsia salmonis]|uniref:hypothetical protein n=1 Tax=Piscirickettsia salmonis TaxID=1238 RepID=UPI003A80B678